MFIKTFTVDDSNLNEFNTAIKQGTGMVAYTADWCGHCQRLKPHWQQFQNKCGRKKVKQPVTVAHCDAQKYQNKAFGTNKVQGFPTIIAFQNGKEVGRFDQTHGSRENPKDLETFLKKFMESKSKKKMKTKKKKKKKNKSKKKKKKNKSKKKKKKKKKKKRSTLKNLVKRLGY